MAKDPSTVKLLEVSSQQKERYTEQAKKCPTAFIYKALKLLNDCDLSYKASSNKRLLVELTLIQVAQITQPDDDATAGGHSPMRLKTLFKQIIKNVQSAKAASQVAATERPKVKDYANARQKDAAAVQKSILSEPAPQRPKATPIGTVKLQNLGFTFAKLNEDKEEKAFQKYKKKDSETESITNEVFTQDAVELQWFAMCNRMQLNSELKVLATRMKNIHPEIKQYPQVEIVIDNQLLLNEVSELQSRITTTLRKSLNNNQLTLKLRQAEAGEIKKILSKSEILEELKKSNPAMGLLCNSIELELT